MTMKTFIYVTTQFEDMHSYPDAPEEVAFLRVPHRHMFHVEATIEVGHLDRELEFILVKRELDKMCVAVKDVIKTEAKSCERFATYLARALSKKYGWLIDNTGFERSREIIIKVNEDGENGAIFYSKGGEL